jgi:RimJ/RimL family protein N-acetyltransferase
MKKQYFDYPPIQPSERLYYEFLTKGNVIHLYNMFRNDANQFVDERFKLKTKVDVYAGFVTNEMRYFAKNAGCDWLIFSKKDNPPVGVLHLFDLTTETFNDINKRCSIGFAIAEKYRRKYFATEAIIHLLNYIFANFEVEHVLAYTFKLNIAANLLLTGLKFENETEDFVFNTQYKY